MSSAAAGEILQWLFLLALYFAMARLFVEVKTLRLELRQRRQEGVAGLPTPLVPELPESARVMLVVDSTCSSCDAIARLATDFFPANRVALLTYEDSEVWESRAEGFFVAYDPDCYASYAPLSAPILVRVNETVAEEVFAPVSIDDAERVLRSWKKKALSGS